MEKPLETAHDHQCPEEPQSSLCGSSGNIRAEFLVNEVDRLLCGLGAELEAVENGATLLRCEFSLYVTEPAHPQSNDAIGDLADVFGSVFFQCFGGFHFEPDGLNLIATAANVSQPKRKGPAGSWGAWAGSSDLRDQNSSRARRYNDRPSH